MTIKYKDNMTEAALAQFKAELQALDDAYAAAAQHDAQVQAMNPAPDEWEDPSDYAGMGWVGQDGRP